MPPPDLRRGLVVGFRDTDPRRGKLLTIRGRTRPAGRCRICRARTYVDDANEITLRQRADFLICADCKQHYHPMEVLEGL